jgi:hypothetical protein
MTPTCCSSRPPQARPVWACGGVIAALALLSIDCGYSTRLALQQRKVEAHAHAHASID